jgi:hypothetical protein
MRKSFLFLVLGTLGCALGAALVGAIAVELPDGGHVYTVTALQAHLAQEPAVWVHRTVRVRALAEADGCARWDRAERPSCLEWQVLLFDPGADARAHPLALVPGPVLALLTVLRRLPFLRRLVLAPQRVHWEAVATYRIQLRAVSAPPNDPAPCRCEALLLDAAPDARLGE